MATVPVIPNFQSGERLFSGEGLNRLGGPLASMMGQAGAQPVNFPHVRSSQDTITAKAGGGQSGATALTSDINRMTTVATAADSVALPASKAGLAVTITNSGANSLQVFGAGSDTINGVATATGVSLAAGKTAMYVCATAGAWFALVSA